MCYLWARVLFEEQVLGLWQWPRPLSCVCGSGCRSDLPLRPSGVEHSCCCCMTGQGRCTGVRQQLRMFQAIPCLPCCMCCTHLTGQSTDTATGAQVLHRPLWTGSGTDLLPRR